MYSDGSQLPVAPYTWQSGDFLTASRLNSELYAFGGMQFQANGTRWHGYRPVYSSFPTGTNALAANTWTVWAKPDTSVPATAVIVTADTAAIYGVSLDPGFAGALTNDGPSAAGGAIGSPGGQYLLCGHIAQVAGGTTTYGSGLGPSGAAAPSVAGSFQQQNASRDGCAFTLDLMDIAAGGTTVWGQGSGGGQAQITSADGSGETSRFQGFWASGYPANGTTVSAIPAPATAYATATPAAFNNSIQQVMRLLNMPPSLRVLSSGAQTIPNNTATQVTLGASTLDSYSGYTTAGGGVYTVPLTGAYLVHGLVCWNGGVVGEVATGVNVNGTNLWGPAYPLDNTGRISSTKTQILDLEAGDTVSLSALQITTVNAGIGASGNSRLVVLYLGALGAPAITVTPPDVTYRWTAGMPGATVESELNATLANDLNFLVNKPYFMGYATTNQTGIAMGVNTKLAIYNNVSGLVHASNGDNYSGWNASTSVYTAPVSGWYLAVGELFMTIPSLTATPITSQLFQSSVTGASAWDWYQHMNTNANTNLGGATGVGLYYLRAGDTIASGIRTQDTSATTTSTANGAGRRSHFEVIWISE